MATLEPRAAVEPGARPGPGLRRPLCPFPRPDGSHTRRLPPLAGIITTTSPAVTDPISRLRGQTPFPRTLGRASPLVLNEAFVRKWGARRGSLSWKKEGAAVAGAGAAACAPRTPLALRWTLRGARRWGLALRSSPWGARSLPRAARRP